LQTLDAHISSNGLIPDVSNNPAALMSSLSSYQGLQILIQTLAIVIIVENHLIKECARNTKFD
jgi:hypothetical protein